MPVAGARRTAPPPAAARTLQREMRPYGQARLAFVAAKAAISAARLPRPRPTAHDEISAALPGGERSVTIAFAFLASVCRFDAHAALPSAGIGFGAGWPALALITGMDVNTACVLRALQMYADCCLRGLALGGRLSNQNATGATDIRLHAPQMCLQSSGPPACGHHASTA